MSGFGLWHHRVQGSNRSRLTIFGLLFLLLAVALACGSKSEPLQDEEAASAPTTTEVDSAPISTPVASDTQPAPPVGTTLSPLTLWTLPSIADLVDKVRHAVASISVESVTRGLFFDFSDEGAGSGIIVRPNGYILTNFHVIKDAREIKVNLPNGHTYDARMVGRDSLTDLAIVKIDAESLPTATFGDSDELKVGDWVVAMGNALALKGGPTVTLGIVSGRGRTINTERGTLFDLIQTDAAINEGNSGGPLLNLAAEVVGINTAILRQAQGIGFAVSSSMASSIIEDLIEHGRVVRPLIGLAGADVTPARAAQLNLNVPEGIIVTSMSRDGPAYIAGIRVGDVITKMDDIPTPDMTKFLTLLWTYGVGDVVEVEYMAENETFVTSIELAERPSE